MQHLRRIISNPHIKLLPIVNQTQSNRELFQYLNIIFNRVDTNRLRKFGPDRTCAEWILRNGGAVKINLYKEYVTDYNLIPPEGTSIVVQAIDATNSSIMHYGFDHFIGCKNISKIILHKCQFIYDQAMEELKNVNSTLKHLQVSECHNVTDVGLMHLKNLTNLDTLVVKDMSYVKDMIGSVERLQMALPNCKVSSTAVITP